MALHADGGFVVSGRDIRHIQPGDDDRLLFAAPDGVTGFNDICATAKGHLLVGGNRVEIRGVRRKRLADAHLARAQPKRIEQPEGPGLVALLEDVVERVNPLAGFDGL